jgi:hypothetical protein
MSSRRDDEGATTASGHDPLPSLAGLDGEESTCRLTKRAREEEAAESEALTTPSPDQVLLRRWPWEHAVDMDEETHTYAVTRTAGDAVDVQTAVRSVSACTTLVQPSDAHFKATAAPVGKIDGLSTRQCRASAMAKWDAARDNGSAKHAELEKFCKGELKQSEEGEATVAFRKWLDRVCAPRAQDADFREVGGEGLRVCSSELRMFLCHPATGRVLLAGTADVVLEDKDNPRKITIGDYKFTPKDLSLDARPYNNNSLLPKWTKDVDGNDLPCPRYRQRNGMYESEGRVRLNKGVPYALQLALYAEMFKMHCKDHGIELESVDRRIIHFQPTGDAAPAEILCDDDCWAQMARRIIDQLPADGSLLEEEVDMKWEAGEERRRRSEFFAALADEERKRERARSELCSSP